MSLSTDYGHPERQQPSLHGRKFTPTPKFLSTAKAYFVCHIGPIFLISLIYAFIGCPQSVDMSIDYKTFSHVQTGLYGEKQTFDLFKLFVSTANTFFTPIWQYVYVLCRYQVYVKDYCILNYLAPTQKLGSQRSLTSCQHHQAFSLLF